MTSEQLSQALQSITGLISDLLALCSLFPINLIVTAMIASLAIGIIRKLMGVFGARKK